MKINKRGTPSTNNSQQNLVFHSRKGSMKDPPSVNSQAMLQSNNLHTMNHPERNHPSIANIVSESQPILSKPNDKPQIMLMSSTGHMGKHHQRNNSHATSQQIVLNEVSPSVSDEVQQVQNNMSGNSGAYMLKLQKYKKMKNELNTQTKGIIKKCLGNQASVNDVSRTAASGNQTYKQSQSTIQPGILSQTTKNSNAQQILFSANHIEASSKENSNCAANSMHVLPQNNKISTMKFSINNLMSDYSTKVIPTNQNHHQIKVTQNSSMLAMDSAKNAIAAKNLQTLTNSQNTQNKNQSLASSKMMMALHKKCNSISSTSSINPKYDHPNSRDMISMNQGSISTTTDSQQQPTKALNPQVSKKTLSSVSQIEFFDENVRVNLVPQITPRHQDKRRNPNERYKDVDQPQQPQQPPKTAKNETNSTTMNLIQDLQRALNKECGFSNNVLQRKDSAKRKTNEVKPNQRYQESNKGIFEIKRRSCGPQETVSSQLVNDFEENSVNQQNLMQSQKVNGISNFGLRKFSQQVQFQNKLANVQEDMICQNQIKPNNPKEEIVKYIGKYIKQNRFQNSDTVPAECAEYQETLQNLRDFLQYLEDKSIINCKQLQNNKEEMNNLIKDLIKLDLNKFNKQNQIPSTQKGSPINFNIHRPPMAEQQQEQFCMRRNSADQVVVLDLNKGRQNILSPNTMQDVKSQQKLPVNSPVNGNFVCYYSPINVSGNGNVVNTNIQIYPVQLQHPNYMHAAPTHQQKPFNCSQKLFSNNNSTDKYDEVSEVQNNKQSSGMIHSANLKNAKHKRVNSIGNDHHQQKPFYNNTKTPMNQISGKMNFAFGGAEPPSQQYMPLDKNDKSGQHFNQRKNSMFVQNQGSNLRDQFYFNQQQVDDCSNDDVILQAPPQAKHRRATTNLIQPQVQTLQPQSTTNKQSTARVANTIFNEDGLIEERDKLIKYIQNYTSIRKEIPVTSLDYYKFVKLIGKGAFGKVTLGIHKLTGKQVAIKTVDKSLMKDDYQKKKVLQEVHLLKKVRHTNVIRLLEVFESPKHLLMVMEYAGGGDLLQYVKKRRRLEEEEAKKIFRQVVYGLAHCHCRSVLHRDIKLDNILLDNEGEIKICDFGVSRVIKKNQRITEQCGTPAYIAPEIISDVGYEGYAADVWSLGVLLYAMLCGTVPFKAQNMHDLHQIITSGSFEYPPQVEPLLSEESKDIINRMLVLNPQDRISIPEILSHPWLMNPDEAMYDSEMMDRRDMYSITQNTFSSNISESSSPEAELNQVNVDNLFPMTNNYQTKLSYTDYCSITQDFATMHMNEEALQVMEGMGFPRKLVRENLNKGELDHATATYNLLVLN